MQSLSKPLLPPCRGALPVFYNRLDVVVPHGRNIQPPAPSPLLTGGHLPRQNVKSSPPLVTALTDRLGTVWPCRNAGKTFAPVNLQASKAQPAQMVFRFLMATYAFTPSSMGARFPPAVPILAKCVLPRPRAGFWSIPYNPRSGRNLCRDKIRFGGDGGMSVCSFTLVNVGVDRHSSRSRQPHCADDGDPDGCWGFLNAIPHPPACVRLPKPCFITDDADDVTPHFLKAAISFWPSLMIFRLAFSSIHFAWPRSHAASLPAYLVGLFDGIRQFRLFEQGISPRFDYFFFPTRISADTSVRTSACQCTRAWTCPTPSAWRNAPQNQSPVCPAGRPP